MSLLKNAGPVPRYRVTFQINHGTAGPGNPMVTGDDWAWTIPEAKMLAQVRVSYCGIPGTAYVWEGDKCLFKYWCDFDGRTHWVENPPEAPK